MKTINEISSYEIVIDKSRFITTLFPVKNLEEVNEILANTRKKYYDATHNCYAYIIGQDASISKCSDDGEPSKTAGAPMLNVIQKNELTNILAITTRYFGGILLGAGGLVRAYSNSVIEAINHTTLFEIVELQKVLLSMDYPSYSLLSDELNKFDILSQRFSESVDIRVGIPLDLLSKFQVLFENVTRGKAIFKLDNIYHGIQKTKF
jgi:uncharacterized YigZ family protein